jgi:peptidoglycan hydrolase-like protein with peptidoglycan-binding domain
VNFNSLATVDNGRCIFDPNETYELEYTNEELTTNASCTYFKSYLKKGDRGIEVAKVQNFLNKYMNTQLKVDGVFGSSTTIAVKQFQARHSAEIIDPWRPFLSKPSGWWYKTTAGTANIIVGCTQAPVFLESTQKEYLFENAVKNLFNKLFNIVKSDATIVQ